MKKFFTVFAVALVVGCSGPGVPSGVTSGDIENDADAPTDTLWWQLVDACTDKQLLARNQNFCPDEAYEAAGMEVPKREVTADE